MQKYKRFIFCGLIWAPLLNLFALASVQTQGQCAKELAEAEEKFHGGGRIDDVIDLAAKCLVSQKDEKVDLPNPPGRP